jgi:peptide deformylase
MSLLHIVTAPDERLSKISEPVTEINREIKKLVADMIETMRADSGVGLAAVQVGTPLRIIVIDLAEDDDTERPIGFYPLVMINPEITWESEEMCLAKEGCLSVPELRINVPRPSEITVKFLDKNSKEHELDTDGWLARCIQHEIDHLDGKIIIDYLSKLKKDLAINKLKKLKKQLL